MDLSEDKLLNKKVTQIGKIMRAEDGTLSMEFDNIDQMSLVDGKIHIGGKQILNETI